jgi:hypothetical protein
VSIALVADTGSSTTDKITSNPAIKGTGQANKLVTIKEGSTILGTTMADSTGLWSFTPTGLTDGVHTLSATSAPILSGAKGLSIQHLEDPSVWTDAQADAALDDAKAIGTQWIRLGVSWRQVQPSGPDSWDFTFPDKMIPKILSRGMNVLVQLEVPTPNWALPTGSTNPLSLPTDNTAAFENFATAMAQRYSPLGVHSWEIYNEMNFKYTAAQYGPVLRAAHAGIHEIDPNATVMVGGLATSDATSLEGPIPFVQSLYSHGYGPDFDAVAMHPYTWIRPFTYNNITNWSQMADTSPSVHSVMAANGDADKQIWITEFGFNTWSATDSKATEANQALWVQEAYSRAQTYDWAGPLFWYSYRDDGTAHTTSENFFGLLRYDLSPKPAYFGYQDVPNVADNTGTTSLSFTLDQTAPLVSMILVSDTGASATDKITSNPAVKGVAQANTRVIIKEDDTTLGATMADSTGAWSFAPSSLARGAHTLTATQTDLAGNTGTASLIFTLNNTMLPGAALGMV